MVTGSGFRTCLPLIGGGVSCFLLLSGLLAESGSSTPEVDFNLEVRPILSDNCFACHGPDQKKRQFELRLDTPEGPFQERDFGGPVVVPGDSASSMLYRRVTSENAAWKMPPASSGKELSDQQVDLIKSWIDQGAEYQGHWAFQTPERPALPEVERTSWPRNPIDRFVLAQLEKRGVSVSQEAAATTLIRRVTYDLTGLPPSLEEVEAFLKDDSPDAYEKVVDRLLESPHYGERMAVDWLDVARYADTHGYHIDSHRDMWLWRDWVINAYNRNMPFDQFTIDQLAGDLLPDPTADQLIATGFNRNHMINYEGGAIPEEYLNEYVVDRVNTTAMTWMGLTMGCARCHDHKYDPITQRDFYRFYAYFNNIEEQGLDGYTGNARPFLKVPSPDQQRREEDLKEQIETLKAVLKEGGADELSQEWQQQALGQFPVPSHDSLLAHYEFDGHFADTSGNYHHAHPSSEFVRNQAGRVGQSINLDGETFVDLGAAAQLTGERPFTIALWLFPAGNAEGYLLSRRDPDQGERGFGIFFGDQVVPVPGQPGTPFSFRMIREWPHQALTISLPEPLRNKKWQHLAIVYDGSMQASGLQIFLDGELQEGRVDSDTLNGTIENDRNLYLGVNSDFPFMKQRRGTTALLDDLRFYSRQLGREEILQLTRDEPVRALLRVDAEELKPGQEKELRDYFLEHQAPAGLRDAHLRHTALTTELKEIRSAMVGTMVMRERKEPRKTFLLERGDYRNQREEVQSGVPDCLPAMSEQLPNNRLGMVRWLVSADHPLTSRVIMNRFWQGYFGIGLVKTSEDFGSQGSSPSHPGLLDWLAREFVDSGWDVKAMQKLIVTSATYRQSSKTNTWSSDHDPENRWLSRASRLRLPAEMIRDSALALGGLLNLEIGGPSVFPYQPAGLWKEMAFGEFYTAQVYHQSTGPDLYRRSIYTFWKRTVPPPLLGTFDAPDREFCTVRRSRTNTPLQPLVLLNATTFVEAARALASRALTEADRSSESLLQLVYRLATSRLPSDREVQVLSEALQQQRDFYAHNPEEAARLVSLGASPPATSAEGNELAAWTTLASIILNLDETITRE